MPLRDHFHPPLSQRSSWEELHGIWPAVIVQKLNAVLPKEYRAAPSVHLGSAFEIDIATFEKEPLESYYPPEEGNGGVATLVAVEVVPTVLLEADLPLPSEYEVLVYDVTLDRRLVAAIEIVSPANKDRPEHRRSFVYKCEALLQKEVCVVIVDLVTNRAANLYAELAALMGAAPPALAQASTYAVACRSRRTRDRWRVDAWEQELVIGKPLPTLPLWLARDLVIPLPLEESYEGACRDLRIP
jgi:hypothetical protein